MNTHQPSHVQLNRSSDGVWTADLGGCHEPQPPERPGDIEYRRAFLRYMTALDPVFTRARERSQFWLIWSLLGVRSLQDPGWDPYESTVGAIEGVERLEDAAAG